MQTCQRIYAKKIDSQQYEIDLEHEKPEFTKANIMEDSEDTKIDVSIQNENLDAKLFQKG